MSISIPDLIWTIICFLLFMLVLNGLLIKPVLKTMDARKERIRRARESSAERGAEAKEAARLNEERALEERERAAAEARALAASEAERARNELEAFSSELERKEKERIEALGALGAETDGALAASMDRMAEAFTQKLVSGGRS